MTMTGLRPVVAKVGDACSIIRDLGQVKLSNLQVDHINANRPVCWLLACVIDVCDKFVGFNSVAGVIDQPRLSVNP